MVVQILPTTSRDRYREEFRSELSELGPAAQLFQAGTLLVGSVSLRKALSGMDVIEDLTVTRSWRCRLGRHHYVRVQDDNPEMRGRSYERCARCGKTGDRRDDGTLVKPWSGGAAPLGF